MGNTVLSGRHGCVVRVHTTSSLVDFEIFYLAHMVSVFYTLRTSVFDHMFSSHKTAGLFDTELRSEV